MYTGAKRKVEEPNQMRCNALSKSVPSTIHTVPAHANARKFKSLNEDILLYGRERSYTFAVRENSFQRRKRIGNKGYKDDLDDTYTIDEYSPKVTKTSTFYNPLEQFKHQYRTEPTPSCGQVKVMFQYINTSNEFHLKLLRISNVAPGVSSTLGIYATVGLSRGRKYKKASKHKYNSSNAVFNEKFVYKISLDKVIESKLKIAFYDKPDRFSFSKFLGQCIIDLSKYDITTVTVMFEDIRKDEFEGKLFNQSKRSSWRDVLFRNTQH